MASRKIEKLDEDEQNKIILKLRQQQASNNCKQPAQDRLKRLQTSLIKKNERHVVVAKRSQRGSGSAGNSTQPALRKTKTRTSQTFAAGTSNKKKTTKNPWAKPSALLDASNRQPRERGTANSRLKQLRESLQIQRQMFASSSSSNNKNNNNNQCKNNNCTEVKESDADDPMDVDMDDYKPVESSYTTTSKPAAKLEAPIELLNTEQTLPGRRLDHMYFVLDTNVLIDELLFVEDLCKLALCGTKGSMLYVPYIVIKELDGLKHNRANDALKSKLAQRAIRYLNNKFDDSLKIQAQSSVEESEHLIDVDCPDDSIVNCCLQLKAQVPHLMLLTNDDNLRLKANASNIQVSCRSDLKVEHQEQFAALSS
ncbi:CG7206 [Drosophila busckii]|uniref:CG7206 n=1 Tax=Drosophila busckii TaxID=30019 RepID=A0A0M4EKF1_DROBS|nr:transcriptional protein SWT1 [Drosophila busckii]ALC49866.1 CG7206 [Drosophila busckii]